MLPLPLPGGHRRTSSSARCRQRRVRNMAVDQQVAAVVVALNAMWGQGQRPVRRRRRWRARAAATQATMLYIRDRVLEAARGGPHPAGDCGDGAPLETSVPFESAEEPARAALVGEIDYHSVEYRRLTADNIALPALDGEIIPLEKVLPPDMVALLQPGQDLVRMGPAEPFKSYQDVQASDYDAVVAKCVDAGVAEYTTDEHWSVCGLFGVAKEGGKARVLLDARGANKCFERPGRVRLAAVESLALLSVPAGRSLRGGLLDLDNYFHRLLMPVWLRRWFGLRPTSDGRRVRWRTMPMGWAWSVYFAQASHEYILRRSRCGFSSCAQLTAPIPRLLGVGTLAAGIMIDDVAVLGVSRTKVNRQLRGIKRAEAVKVKESKYKPARPGQAVRIWGIQLDARGFLRPEAGRVAALLEFTRGVLRVTRTGKTIRLRLFQRLVGKWLWVVLLFRPLLSIMRPLFGLAHSPAVRVYVGLTSRRALETLIALSPLLVVDPARPAGTVFASDASTTGGGVALAHPAAADKDTLFWKLASYTYFKGRSDLSSSEYTAGMGDLVQQLRFDSGFGWAWSAPEFIMVSEARALLTGLQRVVCAAGGRGARHLALVDNQGLVFAMRKGTSSRAEVNHLIQRMGALLLAANSSVYVPWIRTTLMPADAASRRHRRP